MGVTTCGSVCVSVAVSCIARCVVFTWGDDLADAYRGISESVTVTHRVGRLDGCESFPPLVACMSGGSLCVCDGVWVECHRQDLVDLCPVACVRGSECVRARIRSGTVSKVVGTCLGCLN